MPPFGTNTCGSASLRADQPRKGQLEGHWNKHHQQHHNTTVQKTTRLSAYVSQPGLLKIHNSKILFFFLKGDFFNILQQISWVHVIPRHFSVPHRCHGADGFLTSGNSQTAWSRSTSIPAVWSCSGSWWSGGVADGLSTFMAMAIHHSWLMGHSYNYITDYILDFRGFHGSNQTIQSSLPSVEIHMSRRNEAH